MSEGFNGFERRNCGEHRPGVDRGWCFDCGMWCYAVDPCYGCDRSPLAMVREFHRVFGCRLDEPWSAALADERWRLVQEEFREAEREMFPPQTPCRLGCCPPRPVDLAALTKELADLVYVVYGAAANLGIDLDLAVRLVHESNMSKLVDGKAVFDEHGKVLKGPHYQPPDMTPALPEGIAA